MSNQFGTNLGAKLQAPAAKLEEKREEANAPALAAVDAVLDGGDLFSDDEIASFRKEADEKLAGKRQRSAEAELAATEIAEQIRKLEAQLATFKAAVPNWKLVDAAAKKVGAAETKLLELRKQLAKNEAGEKAGGIGAFRTMRDTLQNAFEVVNALTGKETTEERGRVYADASGLYNQAMAQAIACGVLVPFSDGKASIGEMTVDLSALKAEKVKVPVGKDGKIIEISREQREVVCGRGSAVVGGTEYNMFHASYWAPGAVQKDSIRGTVRSFRTLNGLLGKISRALGEAKDQSRKALVAVTNLTAQDVLDRKKDGAFVSFFDWKVQDGTKTVQAFLAVEVDGGTVTVSDAAICLRRDQIGIRYPGRLDSRLFGILRRLAETKPKGKGQCGVKVKSDRHAEELEKE